MRIERLFLVLSLCCPLSLFLSISLSLSLELSFPFSDINSLTLFRRSLSLKSSSPLPPFLFLSSNLTCTLCIRYYYNDERYPNLISISSSLSVSLYLYLSPSVNIFSPSALSLFFSPLFLSWCLSLPLFLFTCVSHIPKRLGKLLLLQIQRNTNFSPDAQFLHFLIYAQCRYIYYCLSNSFNYKIATRLKSLQ